MQSLRIEPCLNEISRSSSTTELLLCVVDRMHSQTRAHSHLDALIDQTAIERRAEKKISPRSTSPSHSAKRHNSGISASVASTTLALASQHRNFRQFQLATMSYRAPETRSIETFMAEANGSVVSWLEGVSPEDGILSVVEIVNLFTPAHGGRLGLNMILEAELDNNPEQMNRVVFPILVNSQLAISEEEHPRAWRLLADVLTMFTAAQATSYIRLAQRQQRASAEARAVRLRREAERRRELEREVSIRHRTAMRTIRHRTAMRTASRTSNTHSNTDSIHLSLILA